MGWDPRKKLLERAGNLLRRRSYSRSELAAKLSTHATEPQISDVLSKLEELGLLNDADYAYNFAAYRLTRLGWGPRKVHQALLRRGVAPNVIVEAISKCCGAEGYEALLEEYVRRRCGRTGWPSDRSGIQRLILHLRRRGYAEDLIYRVLREKIPGDVWRSFEVDE